MLWVLNQLKQYFSWAEKLPRDLFLVNVKETLVEYGHLKSLVEIAINVPLGEQWTPGGLDDISIQWVQKFLGSTGLLYVKLLAQGVQPGQTWAEVWNKAADKKIEEGAQSQAASKCDSIPDFLDHLELQAGDHPPKGRHFAWQAPLVQAASSAFSTPFHSEPQMFCLPTHPEFQRLFLDLMGQSIMWWNAEGKELANLHTIPTIAIPFPRLRNLQMSVNSEIQSSSNSADLPPSLHSPPNFTSDPAIIASGLAIIASGPAINTSTTPSSNANNVNTLPTSTSCTTANSHSTSNAVDSSPQMSPQPVSGTPANLAQVTHLLEHILSAPNVSSMLLSVLQQTKNTNS
ncbi:hypothetical protein Pelo_2552 [Pelomyxa schiedti]|nr:hypothetical protein Pelo_2552 [Pelomyxa schiedti]